MDRIRDSLRNWKQQWSRGERLQYNIIVAPMHFSNAGFIESVNQEVFGGNAILLRIDFDKEYRSNAYTKFSYLRNYGTDSIITFSSDGMKNLERAKELFAQLCEKESYYPLNSLAIGHCLQGEYCEAVKIWEKINAQQIEIDFCRFSILNNLFCAYIKSDNLRMANEIKTQLSRSLNISETINDLKSFIKKRPDVQHPVRQYLLNCGLLELKT